MNNHTRLLETMRIILGDQGIAEVAASGEFKLSDPKPLLFPGAVYGFAACLSEQEVKALFMEAQARGTSRLKDFGSFKPLHGSLYPIYWGKDKQLGARLYQHLGNPSKTGAIRLSTYSTLLGKALVCASLVVSDNISAERILQTAFPDLLKTSTTKYLDYPSAEASPM